MPTQELPARRLRRRQISGPSAALAFGLALIGLIGAATETVPGGPLAQGQAAVINALLCGIALAIALAMRHHSPQRRFLISILSTLPLLIVSLVLAEGLLHLGLLIERPDLQPLAQHLRDHPGRMSIAMCVGISAIALGTLCQIWLPGRRSARIAIATAALAAALGLVGILGNALALDFLYHPLGPTRTTPMLAWLLVILAVALWGGTPLPRVRSPADDFRLNSVIRVVVVIVATCTGLASFTVMQRRLEGVLGEQLSQQVLERANFTVTTLEAFEERAALVTATPGLDQLIEDATSRPGATDKALTQVALDFLPHGYSAIAFTDAGGRPLAAAGRFSPEGTKGEDVSITLKGRDGSERMGFDDEYFLFVRTPVLRDRSVIGYAITQQPMKSLTRLTTSSGSMSASTVVSLCAARASQVVCFPSSQHARPFQLDAADDAALMDSVHRALAGSSGSKRASGRSDEPLLAAYRPVGDTGIAIIMTSDLSDIYAPIRAALERIFPLVVLLAIGAILIVQWFVRPLLKQLLAARRVAEQSEARFRAAAEGSLDALYIFEAVRGPDHQVTDFKFTYVNSHGERLLGVPRNALLGALLCERLRDTRKSGWFDRYVRVLDTHNPISGEATVWWPGMRSNWIHQHVAPLGDGIAVTVRDISAQKAADELLRHAAHTDNLTGLPNRALLLDRIERAMLRSRRHGGPIAVFYIDVDHFKRVNDRHGHAAGDAVLREFSARLSRSVRAEDTVARLGGDEFCILIEGIGGRLEAFRIADSMLAAIRVPMAVDGTMVHVTGSIGVAFYKSVDQNAAQFLARADEALYEVKRRGRDGYYAAESESPLLEA